MAVATAKRFTVNEYHQLIKLGFLTEGDRHPQSQNFSGDHTSNNDV